MNEQNALFKRRPRYTASICMTSDTLCIGYVMPAPLLLATATVSLMALRRLLLARHPLARWLRQGEFARRRMHRAAVQFITVSRQRLFGFDSSARISVFGNGNAVVATASTPADLSDINSNLDELRDRAFAQLDNERLAVDATDGPLLTDEQFQALPSMQRRELLAATFEYRKAQVGRLNGFNSANVVANAAPAAVMGQRRAIVPKTMKSPADRVRVKSRNETRKKRRTKRAQTAFWRAAESVNGRAAALGFMLCLAREIAEPGHPSLFEQVVDVVVPIAQSTPPFLVAVCDRLADLLT